MNYEAGRIDSSGADAAFARTDQRHPRRGTRARMYMVLAALDSACILASFFIASLIYEGEIFASWLVISTALVPIYFGAAANSQAFTAGVFEVGGRGTAKAISALILSIGILTFVAFYLKVGASFSRGTFTVGSIISVAAIALIRPRYLNYCRAVLGDHVLKTFFITDGDSVSVSGNYSAIIPADAWLDPNSQSPQMYHRLAEHLAEADRVVIDCAPERRLQWVKALKGANIRGEVLAPELEALAPLGVSTFGNQTTIVVAEGPLSRVDAALKRLFDVVVSSVALILLSPVFLLVSFLIKLTSEGPVFFVQTRIGQGNRMFRMLKFRSMRVDNCDTQGTQSTAREDDRVTAIGRLIRKSSLDELPQLVNVLRGDMSIVGPRPHALGSRAADKLFWEVDERYWHRHALKPGLTGLAQVRGFRGATEQESDLTDRLQADLEYLRDWSLGRDVLIMLQTFRVIFHRNAF